MRDTTERDTTEYCIIVRDPRGRGQFRPLANTITTNREITLQKLKALRVAFPGADWDVASRLPREWFRLNIQEIIK